MLVLQVFACQSVCFDVDYWFNVCGPLFCMWVWFEGWCYDLGLGGSLGLVCVKFVMGLGFRQCLYEGYLGLGFCQCLYMRDVWFGCSLEFGISSIWLVFV